MHLGPMSAFRGIKTECKLYTAIDLFPEYRLALKSQQVILSGNEDFEVEVHGGYSVPEEALPRRP